MSEKRDVEDSIFNILKKIFKERQDFLNIFDTTKMSLDEILLWIEENIPKEYKNEALAKAYYALGNADVFRGRIYKNQSWRFLIYQNIFQSAGISYAKKLPLAGFTKYDPPKRILKIWLNNQKIQYKKTIAKKYAKFVHCSVKRAMRDFSMIKLILKKYAIQKQLQLGDEEINFLNNGKG
jgi:replication factor C large subunit